MSFDYSKIPEGYYDSILNGPDGMRKFWHYHKFDSVMRYMPEGNGEPRSLLDFGCFAGSFLGLVSQKQFATQVGVDILPQQIAYAQRKYGTAFREFRSVNPGALLSSVVSEKFDVITLIEVIEHLDSKQIQKLLFDLCDCLKPEGCIIMTTPNYFSLWPLLEWMIDRMGDVQYEEQHLTRFHFFNFEKKVKGITGSLNLECEKKTTTHFITPYIAAISYPMAVQMSQAISSAHWNNPLGSLILSSWRRP